MKCSARFSQVRASLPAWAPAGSTTRPIRGATARWGRWSPRASRSSPTPRRRAASPNSGIHSTTDRAQGTSRSTRRSCCASRSGSSSISPQGRRRDRAPLLIVAPMSGHYATLLRGTVERLLPGYDVYITDWRDAKLVPAGGRQLRSRRLYRLSDRVPRADRQEHRRAAASARGLPAGGAGLRRDGADERRQESVAAQDADHDGRPDRHAQSADRGQHAGDPAAVQLVREERHRDRADDLPGRRAGRFIRASSSSPGS